MKQRRVPNTISKRFRRKLRRSKDPFLLWLRCKRPAVYARLTRLWSWQFLDRICSIPPHATPFVALMTKDGISITDLWRTDDLEAHARDQHPA